MDIFLNIKTKRLLNVGPLIRLLFVVLISSSLFSSCDEELEITIDMGEPIVLSVSKTEITLEQAKAKNTAVEYSWTTGTNRGTQASISYTFQIDLSGNNFTKAITAELGKAVFAKTFSFRELNDILLDTFGVLPNTQSDLEARVIAKVSSDEVEPDYSDVITIAVTPYEPVSTTMYFMGNAAPNGWDASKATPMDVDPEDPTIFTFQGDLKPGQLKFITTLGALLPSYQKGEDENSLLYRTDDTQPNVNFVIPEAGIYNISMNLIDLTISITLKAGPGYDVLYIFGSATPNGWDIENALEMLQNPADLFQFTFEGVLSPGEFKIPLNKNTDLQQDMFMRDPDDSTKAYLHIGGDPDDSNWNIYKENWYTLLLDVSDNTISVEPFTLYIIGSATPVGWDISNAIELEQDPLNWYEFRYEGPLTEGEFKFPINRQTDWGQDMYMKDPGDPSKMYRHTGGEEDDEKWIFTPADAGNYILIVNVKDLTIDIQKQ
jgi:hypothetical protein